MIKTVFFLTPDSYFVSQYDNAVDKVMQYRDQLKSFFPRLRDLPPVPRGESRNLGKRLEPISVY